MKRSEVQIERTWDLSGLARDGKDAKDQMQKAVEAAIAFEAEFSGNLRGAEDVLRALTAYNRVRNLSTKPVAYAELFYAQDGSNEEAMALEDDMMTMAQEMEAHFQFLDHQLLALADDVLAQAEVRSEDASTYLRALRKRKAHTPSEDVQKALLSLSPVIKSPYRLYETCKSADMRFPDFEAGGKTYPMTFGLFEDHYESEQNTEVRRKAFRVFHDTLSKYSYTLGENFQTELRAAKALSEIRGYASVFDMFLDEQDIPRDVYERHIDTLERELPIPMRAYARKLKEKYGFDRMTYADLKIALMPEFEREISIEESKEYLRKGLAILGQDYVDETMRAIDTRRIDFAENEGKCTGAFCATPYGLGSYVLISWTGKMNEVFVLAHELGHAGHFRLAHAHTSYLDSEPSLYLIECPSTANEMLLAESLIRENEDPVFRNWVYSQMIERTYYHNFVTHGIEAIFQRKALRLIDEKKSANGPVLNRLFRETLEEFWGGEVEITEGAELTWMRQPHYFMGLYSYTYQAGLSIATEVFRKITAGDGQIVPKYVEALKSGGKMLPVEWAKALGVEISRGEALSHTIAYIGEIVSKIR